LSKEEIMPDDIQGPVQILVGLIASVISFVWARSKGFNGFAWMLAGGIFGWVFLALLMPAKGPKCPPELQSKRARRGNIIGLTISVIAILVLVARYVS
jgi:hypothetical protein